MDKDQEEFEKVFRKFPWPYTDSQLRKDDEGDYLGYNAFMGWTFWKEALDYRNKESAHEN